MGHDRRLQSWHRFTAVAILLAAFALRMHELTRQDIWWDEARNIEVSLRYLGAWLSGNGCVPIHHLMEDAATAEISRAQLWQWLHHATGVLDTGVPVDTGYLDAAFDEVERSTAKLLVGRPESETLAAAGALLRELVFADSLADFLTVPAYEML